MRSRGYCNLQNSLTASLLVIVDEQLKVNHQSRTATEHLVSRYVLFDDFVGPSDHLSLNGTTGDQSVVDDLVQMARAMV